MINAFSTYGLLKDPFKKQSTENREQTILNNISLNNTRLANILLNAKQFNYKPTSSVEIKQTDNKKIDNKSFETKQNSSNNIMNKLLDFVSVFEGGKKFGQQLESKELTGYRLHDNKGDHKTFGYGLLYHPDGGFMDEKKSSYTQKELEELYKREMQTRIDKVTGWAKNHNVQLNDNQITAIASACYNFGDGFLKKQIMTKVAANPNDPSIKSDWEHLSDKQSAKFPGLKKRRIAEAELYFGK